MSRNKIFLMEHIWLALTVITLAFFVYATIKQGFSKSYIMLILSGLSFLMFQWRKALRKKDERDANK